MNSLTDHPDHSHALGAATFVRAKDELRAALAPHRAAGRTIGLVPTMGYLHEGHLSLLRAAREQCDVVVMSLFVNPTQFGRGRGPRPLPARRGARRAPRRARPASTSSTRPPSRRSTPRASRPRSRSSGLTEVLDGDPARRGPGHFRGVTTVVAKLFNTVQPDVAYFGQKDAQQLAVIRRMVRDLDFPVRIEGLPTVREDDGLAMSSRNAYLEPEDRERAAALSRALRDRRAAAPARTSLAAGIAAARAELAEAGIEPEYLEARDPDDLTPVGRAQRPARPARRRRPGRRRAPDRQRPDPARRRPRDLTRDCTSEKRSQCRGRC